MTGVNNVSGNGQEYLSSQPANILSESADIGKDGLDSGAMEVESGGSVIEMPGGISPLTCPKEYTDGPAQTAASDEMGAGVSGFEELNSQEGESARKEQNDNTAKVLQHMEKIYLGEETGPESLGETAGQKKGAEGAEASQVNNESS
jgi:hypothetical protein